jgi:DNA polymerase-1
MLNHHEPLMVAVDYVVDGPRTAAAVAAGRSRLTGMNYQTADNLPQEVAANEAAGVLHGLDGRPRLYNDVLFELAVEAQNDLPSPAGIDDIDDIRTMLCLLFGGDPGGNQELAIDRGERIRIGLDRVHNPLALCARLSQQIAVAHLHDLYREIELPVLAPVLAMTLGGVRVNRLVLESIAASSAAQMEIAQRQVQEIAGRPLNLDSSPELIHYLYEELGLPVPSWTANNNPSTSNKALQALATQHPAASPILAYQQQKPVRDTAISLLDNLGPDSIVHAVLDPLGAATGRFSCSSPNLQGLAAPVLPAIEAAPGCVLMEADYSQMELRVLAHFSQDPALLHAFQHDIDLHIRTASQVLDIAEDAVTDEQRQLGKTLNFGIVYGQTAYGLADELGVPMQRAEELLAADATAYPGVAAWIAAVHAQAGNVGEVRTLYGRRRYLPNIHSANDTLAAESRRHAVNTIVQGTAADLMKLALIRLNDALPDEVRMLLPVHDSVLLEVPSGLVEETRRIVVAAMESVPNGFTVPLRIDIHTGRTWADCK